MHTVSVRGCGSKRQKILRALNRLVQSLQQLAQVFVSIYEINFRRSKTPNAYTQIVRWNGALGDFTLLSSHGGAQYGVANGDVVKATVMGNVITVYLNGAQVNQATDDTYTNGSPGMGFYLRGTSSVTVDYGFTSFQASDQP